MSRSATTVRDVNSHEFIKAYARHLKESGDIELPSWVDLIKTGTRKQLAPYDPDWYFVRAAAVARKVYLHGASVGQLRRWFGGRKKNGTCREHFCKDAGGVIRHVMQQLEKIGVVQKNQNG